MSAYIDSCRLRAFSRLLGVYLLLPLKEISEDCAYCLLDLYCTPIVFTLDITSVPTKSDSDVIFCLQLFCKI